MKKITAIVTTVIMILSMFSTVISAAAPTLDVSSATAVAGATVSISVSVSDNPGIAAYALKLNFDKEMLTPVSISGDGVVSNIQQSDIDLSSLDFVTATWSDESNFSSDGDLFTVTFKIRADATGSTGLTLSYEEGDICNQNLEDVNPGTQAGTVTVADMEIEKTIIVIDPDNVVSIKLDDVDTAVLIHSKYNDGRLVSVSETPLIFLEGEAFVYIETLASGDKLMVWDSLDGMRALTGSCTVN